jgi:uncharacterized phage-associated protein
MYNAVIVANTILYEMWKQNKDIRPMKLQKLLYYISGFFYKEYKTDLLCEIDNFYKWKWGPVIPKIYDFFSIYGGNPITQMSKGNLDNFYIIGQTNSKFYLISEKILNYYGDKDDLELSAMTHKHEAWDKPLKNHIIPKDLIHKTFGNLIYGE